MLPDVADATGPPSGDGGDGGEDDGVVRLSVPAATANLRVVRLVAASLAADLEFGVDEIEDVRVAVDELAAVLLEPAEPNGDGPDLGRLDVRYEVDGEILSVHGSCRAPRDGSEAPAVHEVAAELLSLLTDGYEVGAADGRRWFRLRRGHRVDSDGG
jgi:hypothetical protein